MVGLTYFILKNYQDLLTRAGLVLILVGGIYNLYLRIVYGCVSDNLKFFNLFVFNLADLCITIGIVLVFWRVFLYEEKNINN